MNSMDKSEWGIVSAIVVGIVSVILHFVNVLNISDLAIIAVVVLFILFAFMFKVLNGLNMVIRNVDTKIDATREFTFSMNGILASKNLIDASDVNKLYTEYHEKIKPILTAPTNPLNPSEEVDYNSLMEKLKTQTQMTPEEVARLKGYLEREKVDAQKKNDNNTLFGIIIALGLLALLAGVLSPKNK